MLTTNPNQENTQRLLQRDNKMLTESENTYKEEIEIGSM